ncbi:MAG: DUF3467 domain-containing protein [Planctomycetota bacterium]
MSSDETQNSGEPAPETPPPLRARVPDSVAGGTFSTGAIVMTGPSEFIVDFLQTIGRPHVIASRMVIPHSVMPQFIDALTTNLDLYRNRFGDPSQQQPAPANPDARRPTPQEIYDDLKLPDEVLSGTYANGVMISHGASEFVLDFLTSFFPQSAVSSRIFLASGQTPRLLESLKSAVRQLEQRRQGQSQTSPNELTPNDPPTNPPVGENPSIEEPPTDPPAETEPPPEDPSDPS